MQICFAQRVRIAPIGYLLLAALLLPIACSVRTAAPPQDGGAVLGGTSWQLVKFQSSDDKMLTPDDPAKYTIAFEVDGSVSARIDCNRGRGSWKSSGPNRLQFGPLALTRAMCPPGSLHDRIVKDWEFVRSYTLKDGHLFLALMADGGIYEFEPIGGSKAAAPNSRVASTGPIAYACTRAGAGDETILATFYKTTPAMVLVERADRARPAFQVLAASGAKYEGQALMFWDAQGEALVSWSGVELKCKRR
jgi:heat shock protein HslJ/membrane-bound inhibitor of C-type lysozyme